MRFVRIRKSPKFQLSRMEQYDASVGCMYLRHTLLCCCIHIAPAWGVYSVHLLSLVFGDTTYSMSSIEFLTLLV